MRRMGTKVLLVALAVMLTAAACNTPPGDDPGADPEGDLMAGGSLRLSALSDVSAAFDPGGAAVSFVTVAVGGAIVGLIVGWVASWLLSLLEDPPVEVLISLIVPFTAYLPAEQLESELAISNLGLVHNAVDWALADTDLLAIRGQTASARALTVEKESIGKLGELKRTAMLLSGQLAKQFASRLVTGALGGVLLPLLLLGSMEQLSAVGQLVFLTASFCTL